MTILDEAKKLVDGVKREEYGNQLQSLERAAILWDAYLRIRSKGLNIGFELDYRDTAFMMILYKITREIHQVKKDNLVDIAGYTYVLELADELARNSD